MPTVLQILKPIETPSYFPIQIPGGLTTFPFMEFQAGKLLTFLVVAQVITLVAAHKLLWVFIPVLCQVLH